MFRKILIANRGEIALRIIRACKELGIKTVSVHSDVDSRSLHVLMADESVCIGPGPSKRSYLNIPAILSAAEITGADAIHPGYGFLSENPNFADICLKCGITFIGPTADNMRKMGDKLRAKELLRKVGIPLLPGSFHPIIDIKEGATVASELGYPIILKAAAGGGGRGMVVVESEEELESKLLKAQSEAEAGFGDSTIYLEKFLLNPRHIEVQVVCDNYGNRIHLGERDCTLQRKHQKVLEEAPSPFIDNKLRERITSAAVKATEIVDYRNVGTLEFLVEDDQFYFMEMNTRIQVEHPVTEMITGVDIVKEQILISAGERLSIKQSDVSYKGHSIECRINAEHHETFHPSPGIITSFHPPGGIGVRVESAAYLNYTVLPHYDSLLAKLIVHSETRVDAIQRMQRALDEFIIEGIDTNILFHKRLLDNENFKNGNYNTRFIHAMMNI